MPTSLTETTGSFNAINNASDGYRTNCTDCWKHIKAPLQGRRYYQRKTLTSRSQRLKSKAMYIKPPTLPTQGMDNINTLEGYWLPFWAILFHFTIHFLVLTLTSEALWQAPHWWLPLRKQSPHSYSYPGENLGLSGHIPFDWRSHHYKKNGLLRQSKTATKAQKSAAKGPFDLLRRVLLRRAVPSVLQCRYK